MVLIFRDFPLVVFSIQSKILFAFKYVLLCNRAPASISTSGKQLMSPSAYSAGQRRIPLRNKAKTRIILVNYSIFYRIVNQKKLTESSVKVAL